MDDRRGAFGYTKIKESETDRRQLLKIQPKQTVSFRTQTMFECSIQVRGHLSDQWSDWFEGLTISNHSGGEATISGVVRDQAALFGVLRHVFDLSLPLVSLICTPLAAPDEAPAR